MGTLNAGMPGLRDELREASAALHGSTMVDGGGTLSFEHGGSRFAYLSTTEDGQEILEVRLRPDIADAALRTPDTTTSKRGAGWVRFAPRDIDAQVMDRAKAWLLSAWRAASSAP